MASLIVEQIQLDLAPEIISAIKDELRKGNVEAGMFFIGAVSRVPDALYLLWHYAGEVPVSVLIRRDDMADASSARHATQDFLLKWNQRIG